jgi:hypothetical protein
VVHAVAKSRTTRPTQGPSGGKKQTWIAKQNCAHAKMFYSL